jgi:hypothetical protein
MNIYNTECFTSTLTLEYGVDFIETTMSNILTEWEDPTFTQLPVWTNSLDT